MQTWDLVAFGEDIFLCLGEKVSFPEVYNYTYPNASKPSIVYKWLVSSDTMQYIHRMVYQRYSTYKSVLKYFLNFEIDKLLAREVKNKKKICFDQELYIFPDLWSLSNTVPLSQQTATGHIVLTSQMTAKQKDIAWWKIKKWLISKVFTTHAEIFQDRKNLTKIYIHDPHKWYYANQQEPRYKVNTCVAEMKKLYKI